MRSLVGEDSTLRFDVPANSLKTRSWVYRVVDYLGYAALAVALLFAILAVGIPKLMGAQTYTVLTGSMQPALQPGHLIGVRPTPAQSLSIGDIITFQLESGQPTVVTHRIVGKTQSTDGETSFITRGDANNVNDRLPVHEVQIKGKLVYAIADLGRVTNLITPVFKSGITTILGIGIIGYGVLKLLPTARPRGTRMLSLVAVLAVTGQLSVGLGAPVWAAPHSSQNDDLDNVVEISSDGKRWIGLGASNNHNPLFELGPLVPGDSVTRRLWVRNTSNFPLDLKVAASMQPATLGAADQEILSQILIQFESAGGQEWAVARLEAQESRVEILRTTFSSAAKDAKAGSANLVLNIEAQQIGPSLVDLPRTGMDPGGQVGVALALVLTGLLLSGRSRKTHALTEAR